MKYNYLEEIKKDVQMYLGENYNSIEEVNEEELNDILFVEDSVTGNASGSYTFNTYQAEENLTHNLDLLKEACETFGCEPKLDNAEWCDVTIRCYLLSQAISEVLEELNK